MNRLRTEDGFTAIEWALGLGLIVLPLIIAVMSIAPILGRLSTARTMAQETARVMVLADDWETGETAALDLAHQIARNHGIADAEWCGGDADGDCVSVDIDATTPGVLGRGEEVYVAVEVPAPAITVPFIGEFAAITLTSYHTERVDDYRSFPAETP